MPKSYLIDYSVTYNREARAEEAVTALTLSGHNPQKGLLLDLGCGGGSTTKWFANNLGVYSIGLEVGRIYLEGMKLNQPYLTNSSGYILASGIDLPFQEKAFHTVGVSNDCRFLLS